MPEISSAGSVLLLWALAGYLLGSVPFGLLITRAMGLGDVRQMGSGNIGATNVLRTGSRAAAAATLLLDAAKGAVAVVLARALAAEDAAQFAGLSAILGHCFPVWLGFRGGKGVATLFGLLIALAWPVALAAAATFLAVAAIFRYASLGSLMAAGFAPVWAMVLGQGEMVILCLVLAVLIYVRHAGNIARLRSGTEPRIGRRDG
jgi:glycerol-3-phosphate acyltransferase PlsY